MGKLVYAAITSLDGFVNDSTGGFGWAAPDEEVHAFVNDLERGVGSYLYGRRMYETMRVWETWPADTDESPIARDYAEVWRAADKVVFSRSLPGATTARTTLLRTFDPDDVRRLVAGSKADVSIGGPTIAAEALRAGLVDECHVFLNPVVVGAGTPWLPPRLRLQLKLLDQQRFASGVMHMAYTLG